MKHYIGMAGLAGYLPNYCEVYESRKLAAESLADLHERGRNWRRELQRDGYAALNLHRDGNEYAEIVECSCDNPAVHSDTADC